VGGVGEISIGDAIRPANRANTALGTGAVDFPTEARQPEGAAMPVFG